MSKRIWTTEAILEQIRLLHQQGEDLRHGKIYPNNRKLVSAAARHFGSWREAVTAAGIDYSIYRQEAERIRTGKISKWSKTKITQEVKDMVAEGESVAASAARKSRPTLFSAAISKRYFGSWRDAVLSAGIDYDAVLAKSKAAIKGSDTRRQRSILKKILSLDKEVVQQPSETIARRYPKLYQQAITYYGSWESAVEESTRQRFTLKK